MVRGEMLRSFAAAVSFRRSYACRNEFRDQIVEVDASEYGNGDSVPGRKVAVQRRALDTLSGGDVRKKSKCSGSRAPLVEEYDPLDVFSS